MFKTPHVYSFYGKFTLFKFFWCAHPRAPFHPICWSVTGCVSDTEIVNKIDRHLSHRQEDNGSGLWPSVSSCCNRLWGPSQRRREESGGLTCRATPSLPSHKASPHPWQGLPRSLWSQLSIVRFVFHLSSEGLLWPPMELADRPLCGSQPPFFNS